MIELKVEGLSELERRLKEFGPKVAQNGLRAGAFAGAAVFRDAAKAEIRDSEAPSAPGEPPAAKTGQLRDGIVIFKRRTDGPNEQKYSVGVRGKRFTYGNTAVNRRKNRVGRKYRAESRNSLVGRLLEWGTSKMAARPWLRPAFNNNVGRAIEAVRVRIAKAVELAARK